MRILTIAVVIAAALWGGYWFVGSRAEYRAAKTFFAQARNEGWTAEYSHLGIAGFPNRFDLTVRDVALGDPARGFGWRAPFAQLLALSYNPYHFITALPHDQEFTTPRGPVKLTARKMEGSLTFVPGLALRLNEAIVIADAPNFDAPGQWQIGFDQIRLASRRAADRRFGQEIGIAIKGAAPGTALRAQLAPPQGLPPGKAEARLDAILGFDRALDRHAVRKPPRVTEILVKEGHISWGGMRLTAQGDVKIDPKGVPSGRLTLNARDWRPMIAMAVKAGLIRKQIEPTVIRVAEALAKASGNPDTVELPLVFAGGWMSVGPLPLGPAPILR